MRGLTHVELAGLIAGEAPLRYTPNGYAILEATLAGSDTIHTSAGNDRRIPWYHQIKILGKYAEALADSLQPGTPAYVIARLSHRQWETKHGDKRSTIDIVVDTLQTLAAPPAERITTDQKGQGRLLDATNRAVALGNLTRDVELRYTQQGSPVAGLTIAVNEKRKDEDIVGFYNLTAWGSLAERIAGTPKGSPMIASGRLANDRWTDRNGNTRYDTKINADTIELVARPGQAQQTTRQPAKQAAQGSEPASSRLDIDDEFPPEEDLPF